MTESIEQTEGPRRSYGSGSLFVRRDSGGGESWYGTWYAGGRRVKRKIGPKRPRGSRRGLTRAQAERELRHRIESEKAVVRSGLAITAAGKLYLEHLEHVLERKPSTLGDYRSILRAHAVPFFAERPLERIGAEDLRRYIAAKKRAGLATKSITNQLAFLHGLFAFAVKRGWLAANPLLGVDRPRAPEVDADIRYLELEGGRGALARCPRQLPRLDRALYLTAAMTGLRQGELVALRWQDVDWGAGRVRGAATTPARASARRSRGAPRARCRLPTASPPSWSAISDPPSTRATRTSSSPTRSPAILRRLKDPPALQASAGPGGGGQVRGSERGGGRGRAQSADPLPRPAPHLRHPLRLGRSPAAHPAGVDGPPRLQDHPGSMPTTCRAGTRPSRSSVPLSVAAPARTAQAPRCADTSSARRQAIPIFSGDPASALIPWFYSWFHFGQNSPNLTEPTPHCRAKSTPPHHA